MTEIKVSHLAREATFDWIRTAPLAVKMAMVGPSSLCEAFARFEQAVRADERERLATYIETHSYTVSNVSGPHMSASKLAKDDAHHATIAAAIRAQGDEA